jgi:hypothetical protein
MLDYAFYDVPAFHDALMKEGVDIVWKDSVQSDPAQQQRLPEQVNLTALANPEGAILIVDAKNSPHIRRFYNVETFLDEKEGGVQLIDAISVSGVGSSALGSAALAWNASTALGRPMAAIVPGYGLADVVQQALGGWFGFEMYLLAQAAGAGVACPGGARCRSRRTSLAGDSAGPRDGIGYRRPCLSARQRLLRCTARHSQAVGAHQPFDGPQQRGACD